MKRVIKNKKKMKNTMYIIFGTFALLLLMITRTNPSFADEGLIIDDALDKIAENSLISDSLIGSNMEEILYEGNSEENDNMLEKLDNKIFDDNNKVPSEEENKSLEDVELGSNMNYKDIEDNTEHTIEISDENQDVILQEEINEENNNKYLDEDVDKVEKFKKNEIEYMDTNYEIVVDQIIGTDIDEFLINSVENKGLLEIQSIDNPQLENWTFGEIIVNRPSSLNDSDGPDKIVVMDRNLGASEAGMGSNSYGYYYQWGNNYGFRSNSPSTTTKAVWNSAYMSGYYGESFIYSTTDYWINGLHYNNLWGGGNDSESNNRGLDTILETQENRKGPCPGGRHVPSAGEWGLLVKYYGINNNNIGYTPKAGANDNLYQLQGGYANFQSYFKIPLAGGIYYQNFSPASQGYECRFWSSSTVSQDNQGYSRGISIRPQEEVRSSYYDYHRANGRSVRCFKNWYDDENKYKVNFNSNGGSVVASQDILENGKVEEPENPIRQGYTFCGWYKDNNTFLEPFNFSSEINGNITLFAKWEINKYKIIFDTEGGTEIDPIELDYDSDIIAPSDPTKTGYTFSGWDKAIPNKMPAENVTITAKWEINKYKITFDTDGGTEIDPIELDYDTTIPSPPIPTKECNIFSGWDIDLPESMPAHDITLKVVWNYTCSRSSGAGRRKIITSESLDIGHNSATEKEINNISGNHGIIVQEIKIEGGTQRMVIIKNTKILATVKNTVTSNDITHTKEENDAYSFAKSNGITTTRSIETAKMDRELTRIQMAKMLSNYAINVLGQEPDTLKGAVKFKDVTDEMDKEYNNAVTKAYQLGIMGVGISKFRPNDTVTRGEFGTALSRLLYDTEEGKYKGTGKYYIPHVAKLYREGIINKVNPTMKEKRGYVMTILMRTVK